MINLYYEWTQKGIYEKLQKTVDASGVCHGLAALLFRYIRHYKKLPKKSRWEEVVDSNQNFIKDAQNFQKFDKISNFYGKIKETITYGEYNAASDYDQFIYLSDYICKDNSNDVYLVSISTHVTVLVRIENKVYYFDPNIGLLGCESSSIAVKRLLLFVWTQKGYGMSEHILKAKLYSKKTKHYKENSEKYQIWKTRYAEYTKNRTGKLNKEVRLPMLATKLTVKRLNLGSIEALDSKVKVNWPFSFTDDRVDIAKFNLLKKQSLPEDLRNINKNTFLNKQLEHKDYEAKCHEEDKKQALMVKASWGILGNDIVIGLLKEMKVYDQKNEQQQLAEIKNDYEVCKNPLYIDTNQRLTVAGLIQSKIYFGWRFNCESCNLIKGKPNGITVGRGNNAFFQPQPTQCCKECQTRIDALI